ncbi:hypothetical protein HDK90DRAFT_471061 [Phyllosticta capitalensis]|uniref:Uncharacterized protein n=1 Tax=Phyllosticta capitalensis TaxID=121624 RepID=A0ABR1Y8R7_9PEZI
MFLPFGPETTHIVVAGGAKDSSGFMAPSDDDFQAQLNDVSKKIALPSFLRSLAPSRLPSQAGSDASGSSPKDRDGPAHRCARSFACPLHDTHAGNEPDCTGLRRSLTQSSLSSTKKQRDREVAYFFEDIEKNIFYSPKACKRRYDDLISANAKPHPDVDKNPHRARDDAHATLAVTSPLTPRA